MDATIIKEYRDFSLEVRKLSPKTVDEYVRVLESFEIDLLKVSGPSEIDQSIIDLSQKKGWGDRYVYKYAVVLKTFYQWLLYREITVKNLYPYSKIRKPKQKEAEFLTQKEFEFIYEASAKSPFITRQDITLLKLMWDTGLRRSEVSLLDRQDVLFDDSVIRLPMEKTKGKNRSRFLPYTPDCALLINEQLTHSGLFAQGEHLFLNEDFGRMSPLGVYGRIQKIAQISEKTVRPHMLRHSLGIRILNNGGDIGFCAKLLGHESLNTTLHYLNICKDSAKENYDKFVISS